MLRRPSLAVVLTLAAACVRAQFVGLPVTGQIDPQRVLDARYGKAPAQIQPKAPSAPVAPVAPVAPAAAAAPTEPAGVPHGFDGITGVAIDSTADVTQSQVPFSFGQVFAPGHLMPGERLAGTLAGGAGLPLQVDVKARHPDGSVRHAVVSGIVPRLAAHESLVIGLKKTTAPAGADIAPAAPALPADLLAKGFRACVRATIAGKAWSACADPLLARADARTWLRGPVVTEWLVAAPLKDASGVAHPTLSARFAVRWYPAAGRARLDLGVDNDWAHDPKVVNVDYDASVTLGERDVYARKALHHLHHARWRKLFWWGDAPAVNLRRDSEYLIATRALPNYDRSVAVAEPALAALASDWRGEAIEPMGAGLVTPDMASIGGRSDLGLLPSWAVLYLIGMDPRAERATLGSADLAGSWPIHYRDRRTGLPAAPSETVAAAGAGAHMPSPCTAPRGCDTPYSPDLANQPALAYLPYLLSGDSYHLEELQFWAAYDAMSAPQDAGSATAQAWRLRALGEAAYATPDDDPLKPGFMRLAETAVAAYAGTRAPLGALSGDAVLAFDDGTTLAPWQDDMFTAVAGHLAELGITGADRLLAWKTRFAIARMVDPGACWVFGAPSRLRMRATRRDAPFATMAEVHAASVPAAIRSLPCGSDVLARALDLDPDTMTGFAAAPSGQPAMMQPALAYGADVGGNDGARAWQVFMGRANKPDYGTEPQFAIVPRRSAVPVPAAAPPAPPTPSTTR